MFELAMYIIRFLNIAIELKLQFFLPKVAKIRGLPKLGYLTLFQVYIGHKNFSKVEICRDGIAAHPYGNFCGFLFKGPGLM